jgi:hypothetical protein
MATSISTIRTGQNTVGDDPPAPISTGRKIAVDFAKVPENSPIAVAMRGLTDSFWIT